jgi:hypothetical protein
MSKATDTLMFLAIHNSWRRGDETIEMQDPTEIGAAIDDAVNLLRMYDALEKENAMLLEDKKRMDWLQSDTVRVGDVLSYFMHHQDVDLRAAIDLAIKH